MNWREIGAYKFVTGKQVAGLDLCRIASFHGVKKTCGISSSHLIMSDQQLLDSFFFNF